MSQPPSASTAGAAPPGDRGTLTITDDVGRSVTLAHPVTRVVIFNRYTTEFVRAIAGMQVVVGIDFEPGPAPNDWPDVTRELLVGQGQTNPDYEKIVATMPDAVFFPRNGAWEEAIRVLAPFRIPVVVVTGWDLLKHEENVALLGRIFDRAEQSEKLNAFYRGYRELLAARLAGVRRKRVYWESASGDHRTVLKGSGWHDMIEMGGGDNIFGDVDIATQPAARGTVHTFEIDPEEVTARRPDVIIKGQPDRYTPHSRTFSRQVLESLIGRPGVGALPAVQAGDVYHLSSYFAGACSKIIGALQIAKLLYPEQFADVDAVNAMRVWLEDFQRVPYPGGAPYYRLADMDGS